MELIKKSSKPIHNLDKPDIYSGEEFITFNNRHPLYRTLMKLEFEDALRNYKNGILEIKKY